MTRVKAILNALLRPLGLTLAVTCVVYSLRQFQLYSHPVSSCWWLLLAALILSILWQWGLDLPATAVDTPATPPTRWRVALGAALTLGGAALFGWATQALYLSWVGSFDRTWLSWLGATVVMSLGLEIMCGRWSHPRRDRRLLKFYLPLLILVAVAAVYRLGNIRTFPGEGYATQVEDVMTGMWGDQYVQGLRIRWEYLSWAWLAGLGIWLGGPTQMAMRLPFAVVSVVKTVPIFIWLRLAAGPIAALVGTALYACSSWDIILSRIPNNHNALVVATAFALLAGPARRGRPGAYVWLGFFGGYVIYEYIAYRPLAVFALAAATVFSLRDASVRWPLRVARPLIIVALIVSMGVPLFLSRLKGRIEYEYLDGFHRAATYTNYYSPTDPWELTIRKRINRSFETAGLFFFNGDPSPVHNVGGRPLIDPVSATLLVFGIGYALTHPFRGVIGLTLAAFLATMTGAVIVTGNFDIGRAGGAVPYTFALIGYGAAGVDAALRAAWGRLGRIVAIVLLAAAVGVAGYLNTTFLFEFWSNLGVRQAHRHNLAYLSAWLGRNTGPTERVAAVAPRYWNVLEPNDAGWLRGRDIPGIAAWDIETMLRVWTKSPGPTLLVAFAGTTTTSVQAYLEQLIPGLHMQFEADPIEAGGDVAWAHVSAPPPDLLNRLAAANCRGVHGQYDIMGQAPNEILLRITSVAPFIDPSTWPGTVRGAVDRVEGRAKEIRLQLGSTFVLQEAGPYRFIAEAYAGTAEVHIDGKKCDVTGNQLTYLDAGEHQLEVTGQFAALISEPMLRLLWQTPDSHGVSELMPLYRLAVVDPTCATAAPVD